ncbi:MAG: hypothetical protein H8F28_26235 [Fibrella sp.]|nr:hypothetical protein [Armatimonadota bacterium]
MTHTYRIRTGVCMVIVCTLTILAGCNKSADTAGTAATGNRPATASTTLMPERAREIAAQNAQGAEADAKKRAAAMAKSAPKSP